MLDRVLDGGRALMAMDEATWRRHANPWSVWSRVVTPIPLMTLALWSRVWIDWWFLIPVLAVAAWVWWNPRAFPPPTRWDGWPQRGVLGEKAVIEHRDAVPAHHRTAMTWTTAFAGLGALIWTYGVMVLDLGAAVGGGLASVGFKLWFVDRCAWALADLERAGVVDPAASARGEV